MASVAEKVFHLIRETVEQQGVSLWDVRFVKEGASYYLRLFIDKEGGISIDDCTNVSHAVDPILDEADPVDSSYYLEVSSPGIERELTRDEHFRKMLGKTVKIRLYKVHNGTKEYTGVLADFDGAVTLKTENEVLRFERSEIAKAILCDSDF